MYGCLKVWACSPAAQLLCRMHAKATCAQHVVKSSLVAWQLCNWQARYLVAEVLPSRGKGQLSRQEPVCQFGHLPAVACANTSNLSHL